MLDTFHEMQLQGFRRALADNERSSGTVEKYLRDVRAFAGWLAGRPLGKEEAVAWKEHLVSQGYMPATINSMLSALNSYLRFIGREECRVKFLRVQRRAFRDPARHLSRGDYRQLLCTAQEKGDERLLLLMETICATGIRVSELRYITVEAARSGRAVISLKGKVRTILLPAKLCRKLMKYAHHKKTASGGIFLTRNGNPLSRRQIWREMKQIAQEAGIALSKVFPHNLRHLFAVTFYQSCRDIVKLADVLGHCSLETTRIYLISTGAEHARQLERLGLVS